MIHKKCPFCKSDKIHPVLETQDYSYSQEEYTISECTLCSFRFTSNPPTEANAGQYYQGDNYISHSDTQHSLKDRVYHRVRDFMLSLKYKIVKKHVSGNQILDLGSGTGYFLNYLSKKGYAVKGIEMSEDARKVCRSNFGIESDAPSEFFTLSKASLDVVTMWHVMEHLYDLDKYWIQFQNVLKEEGRLFVAVPNHSALESKYYDKYWAGYDVPRHLWHFTPKTIKAWGERYQFELVQQYKMPFDPFYNSLLSEGYKKSTLAALRALIIGFISLCNSIINKNKSSSIIYVFKKKSE